MLYQSTRSDFQASDLQAVLQGLAPDGGLFVDPLLPRRSDFDWAGCLEKPALGMAAQILAYLLPGFSDMPLLVRQAYAGKFESEELTPLRAVGDRWVLELFRGPTSAFKDVALSMLPRLITAAREQTGCAREIAVLTATSGDTGKAALEGFHDVPGTRILVFYPARGVSPIQRAQMATQEGGNVCVCAVEGNFDDCQRAVKQAFEALGSQEQAAGVQLSSANSINIGRLAPQVVYYFIAYARLMQAGAVRRGDPVDFVVPTGNFGDILAGYFAKCLGLPVGRLVCASNANRVLTDFLETGVYDQRRPFLRTASPSMDILVSSNLERLLFYAAQGDTQQVRAWMQALERQGCYRVSGAPLRRIQETFAAGCCDEARTREAIRSVWARHRYLLDPHSAVAWAVSEEYAQKEGAKRPLVVLSTASPYKFPAAALEALGGDCAGDEFAQMERLACLSGVPIPRNLRTLKEKPVLHRDCISREAIIPYILQKLHKEE